MKLYCHKKGAALVLTLAILVIATILVVGFAASMRTERQAAASIVRSHEAEILTQAAIDHAMSILDKNIPQPVPPGGSIANPTNWTISPGLLTTVKGTNTVVQTPLSSNPSVAYTSTNHDAQLNVPLLSGAGYTILPTADSMRTAWVPVLRDPTSAAGATNQITGRYSFWIDDEGSKININTAYGKAAGMDFTALTPGRIAVNGALYPLGHPSSVNLDVLGSLDQSALATAVSQRKGLTNIDDIKSFVTTGTPEAFLNSNRFNITVSSRSPEFNAFGKARLFFLRSGLSQRLGYPAFQYFRDKDAPPYFPTEENAQGADRHSTYYTAAAISAYLNRKDWPSMPARSFVDKWGGNTAAQREADQVAWNLLSFGAFAAGDFSGPGASSHYYELANAAASGETGFVSINKPNQDAVLGSLSNKAMLPAYPLALVNEVSLVISPESYTLTDGTQKYRLHVSLNVELWLPPGYPKFDFAASPTIIGMTYLMIHATQAPPGTANATQEDAKYVDRSGSPNDNGIRKLWISNNTGTLNPGQYATLTTTLPCYVRNTTGFSDGEVGAEDFTTSGMITMDVRMRLFALTTQSGTKRTYQLIPVWDTHDPATTPAPTSWNPPPPSAPAYLKPPTDDSKDYIAFQFQLDPSSFSSGEMITRSLEVPDPRIGGIARVWQQAPHFTEPTTQNADTMGTINSATTTAGYDTKKIAFVDLSQTGLTSPRPSIGFLSFVPIGMQRGLPGSTPRFQPSGSKSELPDWLLLDLVAPNAVASNYTTMSYMNSTAGVINVNANITPAIGTFSRWQPLQALFENMPRVSGTGSASTMITNILNHKITKGSDFGASGVYDYPGEICEVDAVADSGTTDWDKEVIVRNLASNITTKSNVFSVWGVAQTVKKNRSNNNPAKQGVFETKAAGATADDIVTGEKRFEAVVERYVWSGNDNTAGNGGVAGPGGSYNQLSASRTQPGQPPPYAGGTWEKIDGPDAPTYPIAPKTDSWVKSAPNYSNSTLELANNPARALMKYRTIYFKYLNE